MNSSLCENVEHIVLDPFRNLPLFMPSNIPVVFCSTQTFIDSACDNILESLLSLGPKDTLVLSLAVKCIADSLTIIQLCSPTKVYVFQVSSLFLFFRNILNGKYR